tara:strand:+ start:26 stop:172 length:147 start_codon:yes stop_codon:yes gene_type:complete
MKPIEQEVVCHKGKCFESEGVEAQFNAIFDDSNIVEEIQHEMTVNLIK